MLKDTPDAAVPILAVRSAHARTCDELVLGVAVSQQTWVATEQGGVGSHPEYQVGNLLVDDHEVDVGLRGAVAWLHPSSTARS